MKLGIAAAVALVSAVSVADSYDDAASVAPVNGLPAKAPAAVVAPMSQALAETPMVKSTSIQDNWDGLTPALYLVPIAKMDFSQSAQELEPQVQQQLNQDNPLLRAFLKQIVIFEVQDGLLSPDGTPDFADELTFEAKPTLAQTSQAALVEQSPYHYQVSVQGNERLYMDDYWITKLLIEARDKNSGELVARLPYAMGLYQPLDSSDNSPELLSLMLDQQLFVASAQPVKWPQR